MSVIRWENPASGYVKPGRSLWAPVAQELRKHPGAWAVVLEVPVAKASRAANVAHNIRRAGMHAFRPAGSFEAVSRSDEDMTTVYARYVGQVKP